MSRDTSPTASSLTRTHSCCDTLDRGKKEIRLLTVEPGQDKDIIRCSLEHASLSQLPLPSYETISYVWGDPSQRGSVYLDDHLTDVPFSTANVLKRMRYKDRTRVVWIDAICINQADIEERNSQVTMMAEIYGMTSTNLVWLGEDDDEAIAKADASMSVILTDMRNRTNDFRDLTKQIYATWGEFLFSNSSISADVDWDSVLRYFASPWFSRLWIVQEVALPARSICYRGCSTRPLEDVLRVATWMSHNISTMMLLRERSTTGVKSAAGIFAYADHEYGRHEILYHRGKLGTTISLLVGAFSGCDASDARDYVYGILGLYQKYMRSSEIPVLLRPDYHASVSRIFRDTTRFIITDSGSLEVLTDAFRRPGSKQTEKWQSWVPQWHLSGDRYSSAREVILSGIRADANVKLDLSSLDSTSDANVLTVKGINLGTISAFTPEFKRDICVTEGAIAMRDLLTCAHEIDRNSRLEAQQCPNRLAHTLITGLDGYLQQVAESRSSELYTAFRHYIFDLDEFPCGLEAVSEDTPAEVRDAASCSQALASACFDRRIFSTSSGHLGRGPSLMQTEDIVAILFGCKFPLVLRPFESQEKRYEIIGYCWVYGVMGGEIVGALEDPDKESTIFHLC